MSSGGVNSIVSYSFVWLDDSYNTVSDHVANSMLMPFGVVVDDGSSNSLS